MQVLETLNKHQPPANLKKCEFAQQSLVYIGYVIGGGKLNIDPTKIEAIMKCSFPINVSEVRIFIRVAQYLRKSIASFLMVAKLPHAITTSGKSF